MVFFGFRTLFLGIDLIDFVASDYEKMISIFKYYRSQFNLWKKNTFSFIHFLSTEFTGLDSL